MYIFKAFSKIIKRIYQKNFGKKIVFLNQHDSYEKYLNHQIKKTLNTEKQKKWMNEEWEIKLNGFNGLFDRNTKYISDKKNSICLGSRTGQEVLSLRNRGINSIGIDLVEFPPYTLAGDIHNLKYDSGTFDLVFCNIIDHCYDLNKAIFEMERICSLDGIIIINIQVNELGDEYSENIINDVNSFELMFKKCVVLKSENIKNSFDGMNHEIVFKKIEL